MGWAAKYIKDLIGGKTISFRPRGNSMSGKIESGQLCTVEPITEIKVGDIVLCRVNGREYLHIVKAKRGEQVKIGNNKGRINGWTSLNQVFGRCIKIEE